MVQFVTDKGTKITARPSGTEPKIKFYVSVNDILASADAFKEKKTELEARLASITKELGL